MDSGTPPNNDPFPRIIIVCAVIALLLLALIFGVLLLDFMHRERAPVPTFENEPIALVAPIRVNSFPAFEYDSTRFGPCLRQINTSG
jgi:hypothetical protein